MFLPLSLLSNASNFEVGARWSTRIVYADFRVWVFVWEDSMKRRKCRRMSHRNLE